MRRTTALVVTLLMGLVAGLLLSGAFSRSGSNIATAEPPRAAAKLTPSKASEKLDELRDFAGRFETLFQTVADEVSPAVVLIEAEKTIRVQMPEFRTPFDDMFEDFFRNSPFGQSPFDQMPRRRMQPPQERELKRRGVGSGCILDQEGHVLTNNHVVAQADKLTVKLSDRRAFPAKVVGTDEKTDLAVIQLEGDLKDLPTVHLGDSDNVRVGQWVLAIGNPFGLRHTVSAGIVSATGRTGLGVAEYESMIQTDAAINPGNSGGPLVDLHGDVIAINTAIVGPGSNIGIGFAIPINMAKDIQDDLIAGRQVVRGYMGIRVSDITPDMAEAFEYQGKGGALVNDVTPDSPGQKAGLQEGDIITAYNGEPVTSMSELRRRVAATKPGSEAKLTIWRKGQEKTLAVTLGDLASTPGGQQDWLGIQVQALTKETAGNFGRPDLEGVLVTDVKENSPVAGEVRPGDVILSVNREKVKTVEEYTQRIAAVKPGGPVLLHILDSRERHARYVPPVQRPKGK